MLTKIEMPRLSTVVALAFLTATLILAQNPAARGTMGDKPLWARSAAINEFGEDLLNENIDSMTRFFKDPEAFRALRPRLDSLAVALKDMPHQPCGQVFNYDEEPNKILASFYDLPVRYDVPYKTKAQLLFTFAKTDMKAKALHVEIIPAYRFIEEERPPAVPPPVPH